MKHRKKAKGLSRKAAIVGALGIFVLIILWLGFSSSPDAASTETPSAAIRTVTIVETSAASHRAEIVGLAEVNARWSSNLRAQVGGTLTLVSDGFQPGARMASGELLVRIDRTPWLANLAEAQNRLALAELELLRERQEAEEARTSWQDSGLPGEPESELVLRGPQIEAAEVQVEAARAARDWAARQLEHTEIRAPFAGIVAARYVSRGESVLEGDVVAQIFATGVFEVAVQVSELQWRRLKDPVVGTVAELTDPNGPGRWQAEVVRVAGSVDEATRMREIYLAVTRPLRGKAPLLPGSFVQVHLAGAEMGEVLELPEGALTRRGQVWYVDNDDTLRRFEAETLFTRPGLIYVAEPKPSDGWRIVRYPLDSFMVGQSVRPVLDHGGNRAVASAVTDTTAGADPSVEG